MSETSLIVSLFTNLEWLLTRSLPTLAPMVMGAALPGSVALVRRRLLAKRALKLAQEAAFNEALASDDLGKLSKYLREEFGEVALAAYLDDVGVQSRLDKYLARLSEFVAPPLPLPRSPSQSSDEVLGTSDARPVEEPTPMVPQWLDHERDPPQIIAALSSINSGESWNALARLRRDLEARFRVDATNDRPSKGRPPIHMLPIPPDAEPAFRNFYRTASRAIHGEEVSDGAVIRAIEDARMVYLTMEQISPGWSREPISVPSSGRRAVL